MANVIKHKRGSGSDPSASNLVVGELAIRTDNGKLFTKMDSGAIAEIAGGGSDIAINTLSSSSATGGGSATFNGSAYRFTLSSPPSVSAAQLLVSVNGVIQKPVAGTGQPSEGFSVDGNDIIFGDAPATGADFFILTFRSLGVSEPADNSVTSAKIVDGAIVNADINASAAIAGSKISPSFTSDLTITDASPAIFFTDNAGSPNNPDYRLQANAGAFIIYDQTNSVTRLQVNTDGHIDVTGNLDVGAGIDVTGNIDITDGTLIIDNDADSPNTSYGLAEALRIDDSGGTNDRALNIYEYHQSGSRFFSLNYNLESGSTGSAYTYTQGNYAGSSMLRFDNTFKFFVDSQVTAGSTDVITPTERFEISTSGIDVTGNITATGRVNIGDTQMSQNLLNVEDGTAAAIDIASHGTGGDTAYIGVKKSTGGGLTFGISNRDIIFKTGATYSSGTTFDSGTERLRITSTGDATFSRNLILEGSSNHAYPYIELHSSATSVRKWRIFNGQSWNPDALLIYDIDEDNTTLTIETNKLGINRGANSLTDTLDVGGTSMLRDHVTINSGILTFGKSSYGEQSSENFYRIKFNDVGGTANDVGIGQPDSLSLGFNVVSNGTIRFYRGTANEHTRFTNENELRIGHEGTSDSTTSSDDVHCIGNTALNTVTTNLARLVMQERQGIWISFKSGNGTHYGSISQSGSNVVYGGQSSDYRIKENVVNVSNGITLLKQLRPVNFNYTSDSGFTEEEQAKVRIGFIAHEFAEICPTGVIGEKDGMDIWGDCTNSEGETTQLHVPESKKKEGETWTEKLRTPDYQQIDFSKAVPVLTAALQEAVGKIETLETKVAALEAG